MAVGQIIMKRYNIVVVGAGGTGGNLITSLGRFLASFDMAGKEYCLSIIDGDMVEEQNSIRQPFFGSDVQQNKAVVMQEGLVECFGIPLDKIRVFPQYLDTAAQLKKYAEWASDGMWGNSEHQDVIILVGAVDNNKARKVLHEYFKRSRDIVYIDSGNEFEYGEVCIGARFHGVEVYPPRAYYFPEVLEGEGKSASELSCGEVSQSSPQHYVTNLFASLICLGVITQFMENDRLDGGIIHFNKDSYFLRHDSVRSVGWIHEPDAAYEEAAGRREGGDGNGER